MLETKLLKPTHAAYWAACWRAAQERGSCFFQLVGLVQTRFCMPVKEQVQLRRPQHQKRPRKYWRLSLRKQKNRLELGRPNKQLKVAEEREGRNHQLTTNL